ncbi:hypothetical protein SETIT_7G158500v2 [Setaria italica]|uniref:Srp40 C-terminal domain-containing protein n=1 Tax=Setaria italica TaxID=4555 RepID=K3Y6N2_SETIT|nr:suppressor protein SRP40 [Setaria italica]RCV34416.1 hypothetical protein SETIT_7G158500v2 [Setaria italica]
MLFVPRQVALAAASSSSSSQARAAAAMAKEEPKKEKKSKSKSKAAAKENTAAAAPGPRAAVVASVAAFLEAGGFPRTLAALQSEADLEAGAWRSSPVNLEELVAKFLDSSNPTPMAVVMGSDEQGKATDGVAEDGGKKKKGKKTGAEAGESENKVSPSAHEKPSENAGGEAKEKKQKKKKDETSAANAGGDKATETVRKDDHKPDGKKKKSKKQEKEDDVEARLDKVELAIKTKFEAAENLNGDGDMSREEEPKVQDDDADKNNGAVEKEKKKKKKKDKSATETSVKTDAGAVPADADGAKGKSGVVEPVKDDNEKKAKKKRKKSDPEENVQVEGKEVAGKDSVPKPEDENKSGMEIEEGDDGKPSNENAVAGKKRKLEEVEGSNPPATVKEDNTANQSLTNGFAEDKINQDSNIKPSKRQKHSSEPKTVNPFQRVKLEDVKFADERLQDNSYWAKGGADTGYGAKAQEILGQVRGRGFRHEKTKKKRGTYRGGQIDLQTHSIKFENSDEE